MPAIIRQSKNAESIFPANQTLATPSVAQRELSKAYQPAQDIMPGVKPTPAITKIYVPSEKPKASLRVTPIPAATKAMPAPTPKTASKAVSSATPKPSVAQIKSTPKPESPKPRKQIKILSASVQPQQLQAGERATFRVKYEIGGLGQSQTAPVQIERWLSRGDMAMKKISSTMQKSNGAWSFSEIIPLRKDMQPGQYTFHCRVAGEGMEQQIPLQLMIK